LLHEIFPRTDSIFRKPWYACAHNYVAAIQCKASAASPGKPCASIMQALCHFDLFNKEFFIVVPCNATAESGKPIGAS